MGKGVKACELKRAQITSLKDGESAKMMLLTVTKTNSE